MERPPANAVKFWPLRPSQLRQGRRSRARPVVAKPFLLSEDSGEYGS